MHCLTCIGLCRLLVSASLLVPTVAYAGDPPPSPVRGAAAAETAPLRRGGQARVARRCAEAEAALESESAARLTPLQRAEVMGEVGFCELDQRKYRDAAEHLSRSLDHFTELRTALRKRLNNGRTEAQKHVGRIFFSADPPDAAVILDGKPVGRAAVTYELFVEPGKHTVRARLSGYDDDEQTFDIGAGQSHQISLKLPKAPEPPARANAKETAAETPKAPRAPKAAIAPAPGVWASWPGTARISGIALTTATASFGAMFMVRARTADGDLKERNSRLDALGWTSSTCREAEPRAACAELSRLRKERDLFAGLGTAMVAASGVFGAATVASFFTDFSSPRSRPRKDRVALSLMATPEQLGVVAHAAF
jgi:hypothetical protein